MKKHLFISGPSGIGKTYILRNLLGSKTLSAGGFITERIIAPDGNKYILSPSAVAGGAEGYESFCFLDYTVTPYRKDNDVFRNQAVQLLNEAQFYPYALIDEFGGYELVIPQFREALLQLLNSDLPCIGVIKGIKNAEELQNSFSLGDKYLKYLSALYDALEHDANTRLITMNARDDMTVKNAVSAWIEEYINDI